MSRTGIIEWRAFIATPTLDECEPARGCHLVDLLDIRVANLPVALAGESVTPFLVEHPLDDLRVGIDGGRGKDPIVITRANHALVHLHCLRFEWNEAIDDDDTVRSEALSGTTQTLRLFLFRHQVEEGVVGQEDDAEWTFGHVGDHVSTSRGQAVVWLDLRRELVQHER